MAGARRKARAIVLQVLYEVDSTGHEAAAVLERTLAGAGLSEENNVFVGEVVSGVLRDKANIDATIQRFATAWPIAQMPLIDRNIIRLAIFEILSDNRVSIKVAINEAVVLARRFGSDSTAKFVNGVLGSVSAIAGR